MKNKIIAFSFLAFPIIADAQSAVDNDFELLSPRFFVVIIAGVLLALTFQLILTAFSIAMGITMIGDVRKTYIKNKVDPEGNMARDAHTFNQDYTDSSASTGVKVTTGFGIWSMLTTSIALFAASALALNLNYFGNTATNLTVALVIWALFFLILFYMESRIVNTVVGGLISTATSGLKSSAGMVKQFFEPSDGKKLENALSRSIDKVRKEFDVNINTADISKVLDKFLTKADKKLPDYKTIKKDLGELVKQGKSKNTTGKWMAAQQVLSKAIEEAGGKNDTESKDKAAQLKQILSELKEAYTSDKDTAEGLKEVVAQYTPLEREQIDDKISSVKAYISKITPDKLSAETLKSDFNKLLSDPKSIGAIVSSKLEGLDRKSVIETLSKNTNLEKDKLENYADSIQKSISSTMESLESLNMDSLKKNTEDYIANFLKGTERSELNYDDLKRDLTSMLDNPKESLEIIKGRISKFDGETVKALVTNNKHLSEDQVDKLTASVNDSINAVKEKISAIETKATEEWEMFKRKSVIQAEHTRKTAASAAWWLVITAVVSAGAAMVGAYIELL